MCSKAFERRILVDDEQVGYCDAATASTAGVLPRPISGSDILVGRLLESVPLKPFLLEQGSCSPTGAWSIDSFPIVSLSSVSHVIPHSVVSVLRWNTTARGDDTFLTSHTFRTSCAEGLRDNIRSGDASKWRRLERSIDIPHSSTRRSPAGDAALITHVSVSQCIRFAEK